MNKRILIISNSNELVRMIPARVVFISSDGNYSSFTLHDKTEQVFTMNLAHCQQLIEQQLKEQADIFIRIGKSLIINRAYIFKINIGRQELWMSDMNVNMAFKLSASREALKQLKTWLEKDREEGQS